MTVHQKVGSKMLNEKRTNAEILVAFEDRKPVTEPELRQLALLLLRAVEVPAQLRGLAAEMDCARYDADHPDEARN